jgi:hypothetical protein
MGQESQIEPWSPLDQRSALLVSELTGFVATSDENRWGSTPSNRAHGAVGQNRSCSFIWAAKQEQFQPQGRFFS